MWIAGFKNINFLDEIPNVWLNDLLETIVYKTLRSSWYLLLTILQRTNTTSVIYKQITFLQFLSLFTSL